jgi:hypothetical protein
MRFLAFKASKLFPEKVSAPVSAMTQPRLKCLRHTCLFLFNRQMQMPDLD